MKKLLRIIPLMVMPLLLSSCNIFSFNSLSKDESSESQSSDNTSQSSSDNNVSSEDSSETSSSSSSEETPVGPVLPTSITISGPTEVSIGETIQLSASVLPENATNKTVTWSHTSVTGANYATINSTTGEVTGKKAGNVTVTAKSVADNTVKATYTIAVKDILPTSISVSGADQVMVGSTIKLTATILPENATKKSVSWTSSNSTIASVSSGTVTGKKTGTVTITAKCTSAPTVTTTKTITVVAPTPTNVTLNKTSVDLGYSRTTQLTATITPSNADQSVTWTTNNSNVATVSSSGLVTAKSVTGDAVITATSVNGLTATCSVHVQEEVLDKHTIFMYICGADLESENGLASGDIDEILSVDNQPDDVNIVLTTGGSKKWTNSTIQNQVGYLARWHIENKQLVYDTRVAKASMGQASTLQSFLTWGMENYPAEKYGLIMWNHGGAMNGCCYDENFDDDSLVNHEIASAMTGAFNAVGFTGKFEWIAYDACLMAVQDVAEVNSHYFNYMVCSQEVESGYGYDYDAWLPTLYNNPSVDGNTLGQKIAKTFMTEQRWMYSEAGWGTCDQTQSVLDLSKMAAYKTAWENLASYLKTQITSSSAWNTFYNKVYTATKFGKNSGVYPYAIFDVSSFLTKVISYKSGASSYCNAITEALDDVIIYSDDGDAVTSCGLNAFCPGSNSAYYSGIYYQEDTNFSTWYSLCQYSGYCQ